MGMTQNIDGNPNQFIIPLLTEVILQTSSPMRDDSVLKLLGCQSRIETPIGIVSMLVAASDRYQTAHRAMVNAKAAMNRAADAVENLAGPDRNASYAVARIMASARTYVIFLGNNEAPSEQRQAQILFGEEVQKAIGLMVTPEGRDAVRALAWTAISAAMAEQTERATDAGYRVIQNAVHNNFY
jgi:hypothetical protein